MTVSHDLELKFFDSNQVVSKVRLINLQPKTKLEFLSIQILIQLGHSDITRADSSNYDNHILRMLDCR